MGTFRSILRLFGWGRGPRPRLVSPPPSRAEPVSPPPPKKKALSAAEVSAVFDRLPDAKVVSVLDGDTLIVERELSQTKIRLDSIDCPEDGQPWGDTAKSGLFTLVGGRTVLLEEHGLDFHGRTLATVYVWHPVGDSWLNVNERMIALGHAWVMRMYYDHLPKDRQATLNRLENWAKSKKVGLWGTGNPVPPWQWRKQVSGRSDAGVGKQKSEVWHIH